MIPRVLEPEAMETPEEVRQYDAMDHSAVNTRFVEDFLAGHGPCRGGEVLDVGTGTARIPIALALGRSANARVLALDLSEAMLKQAAANIAAAGLSDRIRCHLGDAKSLRRSLRRGLVRGRGLEHDHPPYSRIPSRCSRRWHAWSRAAERSWCATWRGLASLDEILRLGDTYAGSETPAATGPV